MSIVDYQGRLWKRDRDGLWQIIKCLPLRPNSNIEMNYAITVDDRLMNLDTLSFVNPYVNHNIVSISRVTGGLLFILFQSDTGFVIDHNEKLLLVTYDANHVISYSNGEYKMIRTDGTLCNVKDGVTTDLGIKLILDDIVMVHNQIIITKDKAFLYNSLSRKYSAHEFEHQIIDKCLILHRDIDCSINYIMLLDSEGNIYSMNENSNTFLNVGNGLQDIIGSKWKKLIGLNSNYCGIINENNDVFKLNREGLIGKSDIPKEII